MNHTFFTTMSANPVTPLPAMRRAASPLMPDGPTIERFLAQLMEATYRQLAGLDEEMGLPAIYAEHGDLFGTAAIDALRERVAAAAAFVLVGYFAREVKRGRVIAHARLEFEKSQG